MSVIDHQEHTGRFHFLFTSIINSVPATIIVSHLAQIKTKSMTIINKTMKL